MLSGQDKEVELLAPDRCDAQEVQSLGRSEHLGADHYLFLSATPVEGQHERSDQIIHGWLDGPFASTSMTCSIEHGRAFRYGGDPTSSGGTSAGRVSRAVPPAGRHRSSGTPARPADGLIALLEAVEAAIVGRAAPGPVVLILQFCESPACHKKRSTMLSARRFAIRRSWPAKIGRSTRI